MSIKTKRPTRHIVACCDFLVSVRLSIGLHCKITLPRSSIPTQVRNPTPHKPLRRTREAESWSMWMVSARLCVIALAAVALCSLPGEANAFGLRLGPFYLGLPGPFLHRHGRVAHVKPAESVEPGRRTAAAEDVAPQTNERATWDRQSVTLPKPTTRHFFILISCCHCSIGRFSGRMQKSIGRLAIRTSSIRRSRNIPEKARRSIAAIVIFRLNSPRKSGGK